MSFPKPASLAELYPNRPCVPTYLILTLTTS